MIMFEQAKILLLILFDSFQVRLYLPSVCCEDLVHNSKSDQGYLLDISAVIHAPIEPILWPAVPPRPLWNGQQSGVRLSGPVQRMGEQYWGPVLHIVLYVPDNIRAHRSLCRSGSLQRIAVHSSAQSGRQSDKTVQQFLFDWEPEDTGLELHDNYVDCCRLCVSCCWDTTGGDNTPTRNAKRIWFGDRVLQSVEHNNCFLKLFHNRLISGQFCHLLRYESPLSGNISRPVPLGQHWPQPMVVHPLHDLC